ncbi:MAG: hypothetical protein AAFX78_20135 [Cyanobacteria bacterium J06638_20]
MSVSIHVEIENEGEIIDSSYEGAYLADDIEMLDEIAKANGACLMTSFFRKNRDKVLVVEGEDRWFKPREGIKTFKAILKQLSQNQYTGEEENDNFCWTIEGVIRILEIAETQGKRFRLVDSW